MVMGKNGHLSAGKAFDWEKALTLPMGMPGELVPAGLVLDKLLVHHIFPQQDRAPCRMCVRRYWHCLEAAGRLPRVSWCSSTDGDDNIASPFQ